MISLGLNGSDTSNVARQVAKIRHQIETLKHRRAEIADARVPKREAIENVKSWIDRQASTALVQPIDHFTSPDFQAINEASFTPFVPHHLPQVSPIICALLGGAIVETVKNAIENSDYSQGLPAVERAKALQEIEADLLKLEIEEERLITRAIADGQQIKRRPDFDGHAFFGAHGLDEAREIFEAINEEHTRVTAICSDLNSRVADARYEFREAVEAYEREEKAVHEGLQDLPKVVVVRRDRAKAAYKKITESLEPMTEQLQSLAAVQQNLREHDPQRTEGMFVQRVS